MKNNSLINNTLFLFSFLVFFSCSFEDAYTIKEKIRVDEVFIDNEGKSVVEDGDEITLHFTVFNTGLKKIVGKTAIITTTVDGNDNVYELPLEDIDKGHEINVGQQISITTASVTDMDIKIQITYDEDDIEEKDIDFPLNKTPEFFEIGSDSYKIGELKGDSVLTFFVAVKNRSPFLSSGTRLTVDGDIVGLPFVMDPIYDGSSEDAILKMDNGTGDLNLFPKEQHFGYKEGSNYSFQIALKSIFTPGTPLPVEFLIEDGFGYSQTFTFDISTIKDHLD